MVPETMLTYSCAAVFRCQPANARELAQLKIATQSQSFTSHLVNEAESQIDTRQVDDPRETTARTWAARMNRYLWRARCASSDLGQVEDARVDVEVANPDLHIDVSSAVAYTQNGTACARGRSFVVRTFQTCGEQWTR